MSAWIKNVIVKDGVIDGFKAPTQVVDFLSDNGVADLVWLNKSEANEYYSCMFAGSIDQVNAFLREAESYLTQAAEYEKAEQGAFIGLRWDGKRDSLIAFVSIADAVDDRFEEITTPLQVLQSNEDNCPEEAFAAVEAMEIEQIEKNKMYALIRSFSTDLSVDDV